MTYTFTPISIGYIISAVLCLIVTLVVWHRRDNPGSISFILMMVALTIWSIARLFEFSAGNLQTEIFWLTVTYTAQNAVGPLMLDFVLRFTGLLKRIKKSYLWIIWIIPIISLLLFITNNLHGLVFSNIRIEIIESTPVAVFEPGPVIYIITVYVYLLVISGLYWLIRYLIRLGKKGIITAVLILLSSLVVMGVHFLFISSSRSNIDVTPFTFSFLSLVLFWSITQEQLFNIKPIAYKTLLESMPNGIIVLNNDNMIIKINPSALDLLGLNQTDLFGKSLKDIAPYLCKENPPCFKDGKEASYEIRLPAPTNRIIKLQMQPIIKSNYKIIGKLIGMHDITALKQAEEEISKKYVFTETLVTTTAEINTTLRLEDVLEKILENAADVVPYDAADIVLVDKEGKYQFACVKYFDETHPTDFLLGLDPMSENLYGFERMVETGQALIISETNESPYWNPILDGTNWVRSYLGAPIRYQGKAIGFINLSMGKPDGFTEENARQIQVFANYAASAISNANLFDEMSRISQELAALNEISQVINSGTGLEETIQAMFRQLQLVIPVDEFGITLYNPESQIVDAHLYRADGSRIEEPLFKLTEKYSISRYVIEEKGTVYFPDIHSRDSIINKCDSEWIYVYSSQSLLGIPLIRRGEIFGALITGSIKENSYSSTQIELVKTIALQSSASINNARLYEEVRESAITDSLTGLDNRRHFDLLIDKEIERAVRYDHELCLIMLDIDKFKNVNDRYGHVVGDMILKHVAFITEECLRKADVAFRYGGEEFIIILPETDLKAASLVAERIRKRIVEQSYENDKGNIFVSVSMGVCEYENKFTKMEDFVNAVDQALYQAKSSGRNRVCFYNEVN